LVSGDTVALLVTNVFGQGAIYTAPLSGLTGAANKCAAPQLRATDATRIASVNTHVPGDPKGRNFDFRSFGTALIDGGTIVFPGAAGDDLSGLYSSSDQGLVNLADTNTPVPGGMGNFMGFAEYTVSGGNVVFRGWDATRRDGLYYVPASGGAITKIVAIGDTLPAGRTVIGNGGGFYQPPIQEGSLSGNEFGFRVDFNDPAKGTSGVGIYLVEIQPAN